MEQPLGFVAQRRSNMVCRLRKSLYSLKQSPCAWFGRFNDVVIEFGLRRCGVDHSAFYQYTLAGKILLVVYVDDIVITNDYSKGILELSCFCRISFKLRTLGSLEIFLGH